MRTKISLIVGVVIIILSALPLNSMTNRVNAASVILQNPYKNSSGDIIWDCVWFGSYPQAEVIPDILYSALDSSLLQEGDTIVSESLYSKLESAIGWDENEDIIMDGNKYRRIKKSNATYSTTEQDFFYKWSNATTYHYFKYEPIKWRVLNANENEAYLLADKALDDQQYNVEDTSITWENCTLRSWLNGYDSSFNSYGKDYSSDNFINKAFNQAEISFINNFTNKAGCETNDKIYLLLDNEVYSDNAIEYGFCTSALKEDTARRCKSSTYAKAMGVLSNLEIGYEGDCAWWIRPLIGKQNMAMNVATNGVFDYFGTEVCHTILAVRPVLHLNLSSSNLYSYAGVVCSDGTSNEQKSEWETISMLESTTPAPTTTKPVSTTTVYRDTQKPTEKISSINTSGKNQNMQNINYSFSVQNTTTPHQTIIAESFTKVHTYRIFRLNAKSTANVKLSYKSSNKKVAKISSAGLVKLTGCGKAVITITAPATAAYESVQKKITITVIPKKVRLKKISSSGRGTLSVTWKKDRTVTGYQMQYSAKKKFGRKQKIYRLKKSKIRMKRVGLITGKTYYVRMRGYKKVGKIIYYGAWSRKKKIRIL